MEFTVLIPSKLDSKYKHMQTNTINTIHTKVLGLNVMIKNMLQVLFVFYFTQQEISCWL